MHLKTRNVNTAFRELVGLFADTEDGPKRGDIVVRQPSRNGNVLRIDEPVTITYERPRERVLFNAARDANPYMHLYEALWMLAGRNDVEPVAYYAKQMREYSDDGKTLNGAYGYRWRNGFERCCRDGESNDEDQLNRIVEHLKSDPNSRRAVLQMWNVSDDLMKIGGFDTCPRCDTPQYPHCTHEKWVGVPPNKSKASKDVCCNLSVMFSIRIKSEHSGDWDGTYGYQDNKYLDITVTNRSNDLVWGLLGANYVHFTFLQEYMAARLGCEVGVYHHFTNNLHVYDWNWKPEEWLKDAHLTDYGFHIGAGAEPEYSYPNGESNKFIPFVRDPAVFEKELPEFVDHHSGKLRADELEGTWTEPFLQHTAGLMLCAFACYKEKDFHGAFTMIDQVEADDWRTAGRAWLERRHAKRKEAVGASAD